MVTRRRRRELSQPLLVAPAMAVTSLIVLVLRAIFWFGSGSYFGTYLFHFNTIRLYLVLCVCFCFFFNIPVFPLVSASGLCAVFLTCFEFCIFVSDHFIFVK